MQRGAPVVFVASVLFFAVACGPRRLVLPSGGGTPFPDFLPVLTQASSACRDVRTLTAELALSGRAGRQRIRGRVIAGFSPTALRLEGVAPFGGPVFLFVAEGGRGRLLLPRSRQALDAAPADILDALAGIPLTPDDLRGVMSGCVQPQAEPLSARAYAGDWLAIELEGGGTRYLRRQEAGSWIILAARYSGLEIEYGDIVGSAPQRVRIRSAAGSGIATVDLDVRLGQVEVNVDIDPAAFTLEVPPDTTPISLEELRAAGPLGAGR